MGKRDLFDLENQIRNTLKNAFDALDFAEIKENIIDDKTKRTLDEAKRNLKSKSQYFNERMKNKIYNYPRIDDNINSKINGNINLKDDNKVQMYISKKPAGRISGILYMIFGIIGIALFGTMLVGYSVFTSFLGVFSTANYIALGLLLFFFISSIGFTIRGKNLRKRISRFKQYVKILGNRNYCSIEELADHTRMKDKFIVKDLKKMIDLGMFPQGRIDDEQTYLLLNYEVYQNYLDLQRASKQHSEAELKRQERINEELNDSEQEALRYAVELGRSYIEQIKNINNSINRDEISTKLNRLQGIVNQIFSYLENNPNKLSEVNKFTNHYLPITLKLVTSYKELNDQPVQGDNIKNAKNEIEKAVDSINAAFEKLFDNLFGEVALDISTDISVLETLFTQEGLTDNEFKK